MASVNAWADGMSAFKDAYGLVRGFQKSNRTKKIMDDEKFLAEGSAGFGLEGEALEKARYKALGDLETEFGNAEGGLKYRQMRADLENKERDNSINSQIMAELAYLRGQGAVRNLDARSYSAEASGTNAYSTAARRDALLPGDLEKQGLGNQRLSFDLGADRERLPLELAGTRLTNTGLALQNRKAGVDLRYSLGTEDSNLKAGIAENDEREAKAASGEKVYEDQYSWLSQIAGNEAAYGSNQTTIALEGLSYIAQDEALQAAAKQSLLAGSEAERETFRIAAMDQYTQDVQGGKFANDDEAASAFLQIVTAFEGAPAATELYGKYVENGNATALNKIVSKTNILTAEFERATKTTNPLASIEELFDKNNGEFGVNVRPDGQGGFVMVETDRTKPKDANGFYPITNVIAGAKTKTELIALLGSQMTVAGGLGVAERLYQSEERARKAKQTNATIAQTEADTKDRMSATQYRDGPQTDNTKAETEGLSAKTDYQKILNNRAAYTETLKQGNLQARTRLANQQVIELRQKHRINKGKKWDKELAVKAFNSMVSDPDYAFVAESLADTPGALQLHENRVKLSLGLLRQPPATFSGSIEQWLSLDEAGRAAFP